jgi:hypothetical protein
MADSMKQRPQNLTQREYGTMIQVEMTELYFNGERILCRI